VTLRAPPGNIACCLSVERRIELLGVTAAQARRDRQRCLERTGP
jgi:hypothetical protein